MRHRKKTSRKLPSAVLGVAGAAAAVAAPLATAAADADHLSHDQAVARMAAADITVSSSGNCTDRANPSCTSFEQVRPATIDGVIALKRDSGCPIRATGGTEVGHEISRPQSHYNGYKIDIARNVCIDDHIRRSNQPIPPSYGLEAYTNPAGDVYVNEGSHWDIVYPGTGTPQPLPPPEFEPIEFIGDLVEQLGLPLPVR